VAQQGGSQVLRRRAVGVSRVGVAHARIGLVPTLEDVEARAEHHQGVARHRTGMRAVERKRLADTHETHTRPEHAQPQIPVGAGGKLAVEAAKISHERRPDDARMDRERCVRRSAHERVAVVAPVIGTVAPAVVVEPGPAEHHTVRVRAQRGQGRAHRCRLDQVVGVEEEHEASTRGGEADVARSALAVRDAREDAEARIGAGIRVGDRAGPIGGVVVDDDRFPIGGRLREQTIERLPDRALGVASGHDDAQRRRTSHPGSERPPAIGSLASHVHATGGARTPPPPDVPDTRSR
jgi:hypothetical protein